MFFRHALEIGGVVVRGEGILLAADVGDEFGVFARRVVLRALEHQMFEKMRDAGFADRIVGRAIAIPDHMGDDRRAMIRDHDDVRARWRARVDVTAGPEGAACAGVEGVSAAVPADGLAWDIFCRFPERLRISGRSTFGPGESPMNLAGCNIGSNFAGRAVLW